MNTFVSPPRLTIPHYFDFGDARAEVGRELATAQGWDNLRIATTGPFGMPARRDEWIESAELRPELQERARSIVDIAKGLNATSIASYGAGSGLLEYWLTTIAVDLRLVVTEYAPETIARLVAFMPSADVQHHDLKADGPVPVDVHLLHRIDTEFTNRELTSVMGRFRAETLLVIPTEILGWRGVARHLRQLRNRNASRAGVSRTAGSFGALWRRTHSAKQVAVADQQGWILTPRDGAG